MFEASLLDRGKVAFLTIYPDVQAAKGWPTRELFFPYFQGSDSRGSQRESQTGDSAFCQAPADLVP